MKCHGMSSHGIASHLISSHGMAWHGMAWHGMAWHGMAWHGMAWLIIFYVIILPNLIYYKIYVIYLLYINISSSVDSKSLPTSRNVLETIRSVGVWATQAYWPAWAGVAQLINRRPPVLPSCNVSMPWLWVVCSKNASSSRTLCDMPCIEVI